MTTPISEGPINIQKAIENNLEQAIKEKEGERMNLLSRLRTINSSLVELYTYRDIHQSGMPDAKEF